MLLAGNQKLPTMSLLRDGDQLIRAATTLPPQPPLVITPITTARTGKQIS